jgi:hypothetical protein
MEHLKEEIFELIKIKTSKGEGTTDETLKLLLILGLIEEQNEK